MSTRSLDTSWCKPFSWMRDSDFSPEGSQAEFADGTIWCRICEAKLEPGMKGRTKHAEHHLAELKHWKHERQQQTQKENAERAKTISKLKKENKMATPQSTVKAKTPRDQGFPDVYLTEKGTFLPGYDSKAKSDLVATVLGLRKEKMHRFTKEKALELIQVRGWDGYLERKRVLTEKSK